jgi:hypothetical protein
MLVSHRHRFIFVHVQKTAGSSFETVLREHFPDAVHWHGRHGHARSAIEEIGAEKWGEYFSFGFVRNPWERLVSWYSMIDRHRRELPLHKRLSKSPFTANIWNQVIQKGQTFEMFINNCTDVVWDNGCHKSFAFNQLDYLGDAEGNLLVNEMGRFENMAEDSERILQRLGVEVTLPRINVSEHGHYSDWYNDRTRDIVADRFARDIAAFGYTFDEPSDLPATGAGSVERQRRRSETRG